MRLICGAARPRFSFLCLIVLVAPAFLVTLGAWRTMRSSTLAADLHRQQQLFRGDNRSHNSPNSHVDLKQSGISKKTPLPPTAQLVSTWTSFGHASLSRMQKHSLRRNLAELKVPIADQHNADSHTLEQLCFPAYQSAALWPVDLVSQKLVLGSNFVGSATNWRGLHESGLCTVLLGHADLLPPAAWHTNTTVILGSQSRMLGMANLGADQRRLAGMGAKWINSPLTGFFQVQREFSHMIVLRHAVIDGSGAVFSKKAVIAGAGCHDFSHTWCRKNFLAHTELRTAAHAAQAAAQQRAHFSAEFKAAFERQAVPAPASLVTAIQEHTKRNGVQIVVPLNTFWSEGYYHWMVEVLPRLWAALPLLRQLPSAKVLLQPGQLQYSFVTETLSIMGLPSSRVIETRGYVVADWVLVPPGSSCGQQMPSAELSTFGTFVTSHSVQAAHKQLSISASKNPNSPPPRTTTLPYGALSGSAAHARILAASAGMLPSQVHTGSVATQISTYKAAGVAPVYAPNPQVNTSSCSTVVKQNLSGTAGVLPVPPLLKRVGAAFWDMQCDDLQQDVAYRQSAQVRAEPEDIRTIKSAVDVGATTALAALDASCAERARRGHRVVLLLKRKARRWIDNHEDVKGWLSTRLSGNVTVVEVTTGSMREQSVLFRCADLVVAPHGAGLAALIFAREHTRVVEVIPGHRDSPSTYLQLSTLRNLVYTPVVADNQSDKMQISWNTLKVALERVGEAVVGG